MTSAQIDTELKRALKQSEKKQKIQLAFKIILLFLVLAVLVVEIVIDDSIFKFDESIIVGLQKGVSKYS